MVLRILAIIGLLLTSLSISWGQQLLDEKDHGLSRSIDQLQIKNWATEQKDYLQVPY